VTHDYHEGQPNYHPDQLLKDGCAECKFRSEHIHAALAHMDTRRFAVAWMRAIDFEMGRLDNVSQAEAPLLRVIWSTARLLGQLQGHPELVMRLLEKVPR
jgi:hypothetical protein